MGIGVVVRNSKVEVLAVLFKKISHPPLVVLLETMAARRAAYFIHEIGIPSSILKVIWRSLQMLFGMEISQVLLSVT